MRDDHHHRPHAQSALATLTVDLGLLAGPMRRTSSCSQPLITVRTGHVARPQQPTKPGNRRHHFEPRIQIEDMVRYIQFKKTKNSKL